MARLTTRTQLTEYTLRQLGAPSIQVELTPEQISDNIDKAVEKFAYYAMDGQEEKIIIVELTHGVFDYKLPIDVTAVLSLRTSSNFSSLYRLPGGYVFANQPMGLQLLDSMTSVDITNMSMYLSKMSALESLFDIPLNYIYNEMTGTLRFFEQPRENKAMLKVALDYTPDEAQDKIFGHEWIKEYVEALCKITWGQVVGKYTSTLVNGSEINFDRILSEGYEEKEKLEEKLLTDYMEPLGIYVS